MLRSGFSSQSGGGTSGRWDRFCEGAVELADDRDEDKVVEEPRLDSSLSLA